MLLIDRHGNDGPPIWQEVRCTSTNYSHWSPKYIFQLTPLQKLVMTTYVGIALPSLDDVSPVPFLSNVTNNLNYRTKYGYGECYCTLSGHLSNTC